MDFAIQWKAHLINLYANLSGWQPDSNPFLGIRHGYIYLWGV